MKLPTTLVIDDVNRRGFLTIDALMACALISMTLPAAISLSWSADSLLNSVQGNLKTLASSSAVISTGVTDLFSNYQTTYAHEFGKSVCTITPTNPLLGFTDADVIVPNVANVTSPGSSIIARNGFIYETVDTGSKSQPDLLIIDARIPQNSTLVSSLDTGYGLSAIAVAGQYIYAANESSVSQLQIIDITNRTNPVLVTNYKLPLPFATSTAPYASAIYYSDGLIFLGTEKWDGTEFNIIDVSNPLAPQYRGGFETNSVVKNIYVDNGTAYVADADVQQLRVLDIQNPASIAQLSYFSPSGSAVQEGKVLIGEDYDEAGNKATSTNLFFARAGGGVNNTRDLELFSFDIAHRPLLDLVSHSQDISGGIYGLAVHDGYVFLGTHNASTPIQIWKNDLSGKSFDIGSNIGVVPLSATVCDHDWLYSANLTKAGFQIAIPH